MTNISITIDSPELKEAIKELVGVISLNNSLVAAGAAPKIKAKDVADFDISLDALNEAGYASADTYDEKNGRSYSLEELTLAAAPLVDDGWQGSYINTVQAPWNGQQGQQAG